MNPRPLRLVLAPLAGAILALSTHAVAQEAAKKVNPYPCLLYTSNHSLRMKK